MGAVVILSDLHAAHPLSVLRTAEQIAPLVPENGTVIFNGDSVEMRSKFDRDKGAQNREALRAVCAAKGSEAIFLTGNHDPLVSDQHFLELAQGRVLVTHGDFLFHAISPWSHESHRIGEEHDRLLAALPADKHDHFESRLQVSREASRVLEKLYTARQSLFSVARNIAMEFIPPWRPMAVLKYWGEAPGLAGAMAEKFRPNARFILIGHLHHHGVWEHDGRTIINTGCYFPFVKRLAVTLLGDMLQVHEVARRNGLFVRGKLLRELPVQG